MAFIFGVINRLEHLDLPFRIIRDNELDRVEHSHAPLGADIQILADVMLQQANIGGAVLFGDTGCLDKSADGFWRVAAPTVAGERGHTRVIPAVHVALFDHAHETPFGHHGVGQVQARKLDLAGGEDTKLLDKPVVKRAVAFVFE